MATVHEFIERLGLTMQAAQLDNRQDNLDREWAKGSSRWSCTITRGGASMTVTYSMGAAHRRWDSDKLRHKVGGSYTRQELESVSPALGARGIGGAPESIALREAREAYTVAVEPDLPGVLDCLASDSQGYEWAGSFEDWAAEYGYDTDSRKAEATYRHVGEQARALRHLLGLDDYRLLIEEVERL